MAKEKYTQEIWEKMVMEGLKELDPVAYVRFASVYRSFTDVEDFNTAIKDLE